MNSLVIRVDATRDIGMGHFMRCFALAQAWKEGDGEVYFISHCDSKDLTTRIRNEGMRFIPLKDWPIDSLVFFEILKNPKKHDAEWNPHKTWVVLDGYHFDSEYQWRIKEAGYRLLCIDDYAHAQRYFADIILNQNIYAKNSLYNNRDSHTHTLLGPEYCLLRKEFLPYRSYKREINPEARKILITMGGGDPYNISLKVMLALKKLWMENLFIKIVAGPFNSYSGIIMNELGRMPFICQLVEKVENMPEMMAWADLAISAGGSTCWEMAFMGLPNAIIYFADNQQQVAESLHSIGVAINLGRGSNLSTEDIVSGLKELIFDRQRREEMSACGRQLIDGGGSRRVLSSLRAGMLRLRLVNENDCRTLWQIANDPIVRKYSFQTENIPWENHKKWFHTKLEDPNCYQFLALDEDDVPIGQVRFDTRGDEAEIDISLAKEKRGLGYGSSIIKYGIEELIRRTPIRVINAFIKMNNDVSFRAFKKAGFKCQGTKTINNQGAFHLEWRSDE